MNVLIDQMLELPPPPENQNAIYAYKRFYQDSSDEGDDNRDKPVEEEEEEEEEGEEEIPINEDQLSGSDDSLPPHIVPPSVKRDRSGIEPINARAGKRRVVAPIDLPRARPAAGKGKGQQKEA